MNADIKESALTSSQKYGLAIQTCQWWNAVFIQADRFFDDMKKDCNGTPWDNDNNSIFVADRMFLIIAIYHAINNLKKLNLELKRVENNSFETVVCEIDNAVSWEDFKNLRDMNVHILEYLFNEGRFPEKFGSTIESKYKNILTTAAWTHTDHDTGIISLGNVDINKLLDVMKEHLPTVQAKTKEIFEESFR